MKMETPVASGFLEPLTFYLVHIADRVIELNRPRFLQGRPAAPRFHSELRGQRQQQRQG